jgi:hypothetical protein
MGLGGANSISGQAVKIYVQDSAYRLIEMRGV